MDLENYPLHLTTSELDYELLIRGIFNVTNTRIKTGTLRELMKREKAGTEEAPKSSDVCDVLSEIKKCSESFEDVATKAEESVSSQTHMELPRCISRLYHLQARLERLSPPEADPLRIFMHYWTAFTMLWCA